MDVKNLNPLLIARVLEEAAYELRSLKAEALVAEDGIYINQNKLEGLSIILSGNIEYIPYGFDYTVVDEAVRILAKEDGHIPRNVYECIDQIDSELQNQSLSGDMITPEFLVEAYRSIGDEFMADDHVLQSNLWDFLQEKGIEG